MSQITVASPSGVAIPAPQERSIDLLVNGVNRRELDFLARYVADATAANENITVPWIEVIAYEPLNIMERALENLGWLHASRQVRVYPGRAGMSPDADDVQKLFELYYSHCILIDSESGKGKIEVLRQ